MRLHFLLIVLAILASCSSKKEEQKSNSLEGLKYSISDFLNSCQSDPLQDYTTIEDSLNNFTIKVPSKWDKEAFLDSTGQGVFMMDTLVLIEKRLIHTVLVDILDNQTKTLPKHFADDLLGMEAEGFKIHEIGQFSIEPKSARI